MSSATTIYLLRHGQSEASLTNVYGTDTPLTAKGVAQAEAAAAHFKPIELDKIVAAPLQRAQVTAAIIAAPHQLHVQTHPQIGEPKYGALEGQNRAAARQTYPDAFRLRDTLTDEARLGFKLVEDMESDREALTRFLAALHAIAEQSAGQTVLIISHVPLMKLLLVHLGFATRRQLAGESIDNAGVIALHYMDGNFRVADTSGVHLQS